MKNKPKAIIRRIYNRIAGKQHPPNAYCSCGMCHAYYKGLKLQRGRATMREVARETIHLAMVAGAA